MTEARNLHTATLLMDGTVLIAGGGNNSSTAELYDLTPGSFTKTGGMEFGRAGHTATAMSLPDGIQPRKALLQNKFENVSEGGLDPRSWWYIPKRGIYHQSKLTRQGPARISRAKRGGSTGLPDRPRHVTCGNDEGGEPGSGRTQGRTAVAAARRLIIREAQ